MKQAERWIVYPLLGALCWAVFGGVVPTRTAGAADPDGRFATVRARRFEIVDGKGKVVGALGANAQGGGALVLLTPNGRPVLELGVRRDAGLITLMRHVEQPEALIQIAADKQGRGQVAIFGETPGSACIVMGRDGNGGSLSIRSGKGAPAAGINVSPSGTGFCAVTAGDGKPKAFLGVNERGGIAGVKDAANEPAVTLHVGDTGGAVTTAKAKADK